MEPIATSLERTPCVPSRRRSMRWRGGRVAIGVLGCVLAFGCPLARADWGVDAAAGLTYDDNLTNAFQSGDRKADTAAIASVTAGLHEQFGSGTGLSLGAIASGAQYFQYDGLDNAGLGARAQLRTKFGLGPEAPWIALAARAVHHEYRDDLRSGWEYEAGASVGKQLTDRWSVRGSLRYDAYVADTTSARSIRGLSTAAYDIDGWTIGAQAALRMTEADVLSGALSWRDGSVTAVTRPDLDVLEYSDAAVRDGTFSDSTRMVAYRVAAATWTAGLTWSHALGRSASVNVTYAYRSSRAEHGLGTYVSNILGISLGYSY
jgi:hypothetical protein